MPEMTLVGMSNPDSIRKMILEIRDDCIGDDMKTQTQNKINKASHLLKENKNIHGTSLLSEQQSSVVSVTGSGYKSPAKLEQQQTVGFKKYGQSQKLVSKSYTDPSVSEMTEQETQVLIEIKSLLSAMNVSLQNMAQKSAF